MDAWGGGDQHAEGWHEELAVGQRIYEIEMLPTNDDRLEVTFTSCDEGGQIIGSFLGVMPAEDVPVAGKLLSPLMALMMQAGRSGGEPRSYSVAEIRTRYPHAYEPWTLEDGQRLLDRHAAGATVEVLSAEFGRNSGGIVSRLQRLGAIGDGQPLPAAVSIYAEFGRPPCTPFSPACVAPASTIGDHSQLRIAGGVMTAATPIRICKRCGVPQSRFMFGRVCPRCRKGRGRMFEDFGAGRRRSPEIPSAIESDRDRH